MKELFSNLKTTWIYCKDQKGRLIKYIIFNLLKNSPKSLTAEEIYNDMSQTTDVNLSTVYRTLNNLVAKGEITKNVRQDKIA